MSCANAYFCHNTKSIFIKILTIKMNLWHCETWQTTCSKRAMNNKTCLGIWQILHLLCYVGCTLFDLGYSTSKNWKGRINSVLLNVAIVFQGGLRIWIHLILYRHKGNFIKNMIKPLTPLVLLYTGYILHTKYMNWSIT